MQQLDEAYNDDLSIEELDEILEENLYYWKRSENDGYYTKAEYQ